MEDTRSLANQLRKVAAEALGTAFLLCTIVGVSLHQSGPADALAVPAVLAVMILVLQPVSGAHFNPAVTVAFWLIRRIGPIRALQFIAAQLLGAILGVMVAHIMYGQVALVPLSATEPHPNGPGLFLGEVIAAFGLVGLILSLAQTRPTAIAYAVGLFVLGASIFTVSGCVANPAVAFGLMFTPSDAGLGGIRAGEFIGAEFLGGILATLTFGWLGRFLRPNSA